MSVFRSEMEVPLIPGATCWEVEVPSGNFPRWLAVLACMQDYRLGFEAGFAEANGYEPNDILTHEIGAP